jgi:hypothetical protein
VPEAADEHRHRPGPGLWWMEWWELVFWTRDASLAGSVRLTLVPGAGRAWYWADVVGAGRPLVAAREDEVELPRGSGLEVRAEGLWSALTCETPLEHWSVGLEAFALAFDDPDEATAGARGDRVPLGLDLEWEADGAAMDSAPLGLRAGGRRYEQPAVVQGDVLIGTERLEVDGPGWRVRGWGQAEWWAPWRWTAARVGPGTGRVLSEAEQGDGAGEAVEAGTTEALERAPVEVGGPGASALGRLERSLCRVREAAGPEGMGWAESYRPAAGVSPGERPPRRGSGPGPG